MVQFDELRKLALSFPESTEEPHFEKTSFRVKKKIFATYDFTKNIASFKLSLIDQDLFGLIDKTSIYPVPNAWGKQGWTFVKLENIQITVLKEMLESAYSLVAQQELFQKHFQNKKNN